ncbi:MAG: hypothetical protein WCP14_03190 [bacterium]
MNLKSIYNNISSYSERNQFGILTVLIITIGSLWRIWNVGAFHGFSIMEKTNLAVFTKVINNSWIIQQKEIYRALYVYLQSSLIFLSGYDVSTYRLLNVIIMISLLVVFFLFVRTWFNKQVAILSTLFMATSAPIIIFSRIVSEIGIIVLLQFLILLLLTYAFRDKKKYLFLLAGLVSALGIFTSPIFVLSGALLAVVAFVIMLKNTKFISMFVYELLFLILPIMISAVIYIVFLPDFYSNISYIVTPGSFLLFSQNIGNNVLALMGNSIYATPYNVGSEPILDPFLAVSAICGIIYAFFHAGKRKHQFLLMWLLFGLVIISLSGKQIFDYLLIVLPTIYIFSALLFDYLLTSWTKTFPYNKNARLIMTLVFSLFVFLSVYYNYQKFFLGWLGSNTIRSQFTNSITIIKK